MSLCCVSCVDDDSGFAYLTPCCCAAQGTKASTATVAAAFIYSRDYLTMQTRIY